MSPWLGCFCLTMTVFVPLCAASLFCAVRRRELGADRGHDWTFWIREEITFLAAMCVLLLGLFWTVVIGYIY